MFPSHPSSITVLVAILSFAPALVADPTDAYIEETCLLQKEPQLRRGEMRLASSLVVETAQSAEVPFSPTTPSAELFATSFPGQLRLGTIATVLVFGGAAVAWALLEVASLAERLATSKFGKRSSAYARELQVLRSAATFGGIICFCYVCEHYPAFPHAERVHSVWLYFGAAALVLCAALFTVRQTQSDEPLAREQTEEWKGWLQVAFLLYHYFHVHEVYVPVRVFVSCYVWMTGFGNYLYFARKGDFGLVRVLQMLWRMNAAVLALCLTLGTPYILYYICPLHTFYFLLTYVVMAVNPSWNQDVKLMSLKLVIAAAVIFLVWDTRCGLFGMLFGWLGTEPIGHMPAYGTQFEWYFRSSIDHYTALFGMLSAHCLPHFVAWLRHVELQMPSTVLVAKTFVALTMLCGLCIWWFGVGSLPQSNFIPLHAYTCWVPIAAYVVLRNICAPLRRYHLALFREIGTTSLETYLLQHHLWLSSNAASWLVLVPSFPVVNAVATTILFVAASRALFRSTLALREAILPDCPWACARNLSLLAAGVALAGVGSWALLANEAGPLVLFAAVLALGSLCSAAILRPRPQAAATSEEGSGVPHVWTSAFGVALVLFVACPAVAWLAAKRDAMNVVPDRFGDSSGPVWRGPTSCAEAGDRPPSLPRDGPGGSANMAECCNWASPGLWQQAEGGNHATWEWQASPVQCHFNTGGFRNEFCGRDVVFAGDSAVRSVYFAFAELLGEDAQPETGDKHSDHSIARSAPCNRFRPSVGGRISFLWRPFAVDLVSVAQNQSLAGSPLVLSAGMWDALHNQDHGGVTSYRAEMAKLRNALAERSAPAVWMTTTAVQDDALDSDEQRAQMTEAQLDPYRAEALVLTPATAAVLDAHKITAPEAGAGQAPDGVHYPPFVQGVLGETVARILSATLPPSSVHLPTRDLEGLTSPLYGSMVVLLVVVAVFASMKALSSPLALGDISETQEIAAHTPILPTPAGAAGGVAGDDSQS